MSCGTIQVEYAAAMSSTKDASAPPGFMKITWTTPTVEPSTNTKGEPIIGGGMPLGALHHAGAQLRLQPASVAHVNSAL